jgi:hypothetical protein
LLVRPLMTIFEEELAVTIVDVVSSSGWK